MRQFVIMPGGFHPFHAGHYALYKSALEMFPNADVYVAATNDTKTRPFPFEIKEKLAKVAGVQDGRFVQVKSPFKPDEILQNYDPEEDTVIFVRSEKDRDEPPKPGGTKKDGSPAYFQPYTGKNLEPFAKHGYIAYLPTVEFGPGIKSATEIRNVWPQLDDRRKLAMVMSLYPKTIENQKLAQNIVGMLDIGMGTQEVSESIIRESKMSDVVRPLLQTFNLEHGGEERWAHYIPLSTKASYRRWRRGDGSFYTDPNKIVAFSDEYRKLQPKFFAWLAQQPGVQPVGKIRGEFQSSGYSDAVKYKGLIFIDRGSHTEYTTPSRLKNTSVWHQKVDEASGRMSSARNANITYDLGNGYFLGDDSYDDPDGFVKEGYSVYYQEDQDQYRLVGEVKMSPYSNPPGHVEGQINKLIAADQTNLTENVDYLDEK